MSSGTLSGGGGGGGEKRGEEKTTSENLPVTGAPALTSSHTAHLLAGQQPIMDIKTLQSIRPKVNQPPSGGPVHQGTPLSAILPSGLASTPSEVHGHITATPSTAAPHSNLPVTMQQNIVHLGNTAAPSQSIGGSLPINVRGSLAPRPQFSSHLPRGAIAAASALTKTGPNIATAAATAVVRPPVALPVSSSAIHAAGALPTLQNTLGRSPLLSAMKQGTPPSTRSPSPAVSIATQPLQPGPMDAHRPSYQLHSPATPTTTQNIQITLTTTRSTTAIEIPKPVSAGSQAKPLNLPLSMQAQSKVLLSQPVNPLLHQAQLKSVNLTMASHTSSTSATPVTIGSLSAVTTVASSSSTIPIAKVTPQRQQQSLSQASTVAQPQPTVQDLSRVSVETSTAPVVSHPHGQPASSIFIPQPHRTATTTAPLNTAISTPSTTPQQQETRIDSRAVGNIPQLPHFLSQQDTLSWQNYQLPYPQLVYQQVAAQAAQAQAAQNPLTATAATTPVRPGGLSTLIFPRPQVDQSVPSQNPNLAATLQAHAMTMTPHAVRLAANSMMVQVDPRHPMSAVHTQFTASASALTSGVSQPLQDSKPIISSAAINICRTPPPATHDGGHSLGLSSGATVASSIYTTSPNMQQQVSSAGSTNNPQASPRPSILRKRTSEGVGVVVKRPLGLMPDSHSPKPEPAQPQSNTSSPKTPAGDNSQSSTDTALSSNDATTPTQNSHGDIKIKQEPSDSLENGPSLLNSLASSPVNSVEASPRKKPRKQLLNATEELKDNTSTDEEVEKVSFKENKTREIKREQREEYVDEEGVRWTAEKKRPNINLLNFYNITWKPKNNHFQRFADVKPKEERRPTVNELSNQRGIHQRASGWKLYHMASQLENLTDLEKDMCTRVSQLQTALTPRPQAKQAMLEDYNGILHELSQANIQRCQLISDQLEEARSSMLKILEHKPRIQEIINKHMSKRPIKKKERT